MAVNFAVGAEQAQLELNADSGDAARNNKAMQRWDRKRKKMVHVDPVCSKYSCFRIVLVGNPRTCATFLKRALFVFLQSSSCLWAILITLKINSILTNPFRSNV